jgi:hypothetical protein
MRQVSTATARTYCVPFHATSRLPVAVAGVIRGTDVGAPSSAPAAERRAYDTVKVSRDELAGNVGPGCTNATRKPEPGEAAVATFPQ